MTMSLNPGELKEASMEPGGLSFVYILKSFLLVFSVSLFMQALSELIKHSLALVSNRVNA